MSSSDFARAMRASRLETVACGGTGAPAASRQWSYRERRKEALERFTHQVAEQVLASGSPTSLEPMSPADRKIVHDTVNEIDGVRTTSEGEEPRRRVVILPD